MCDCQSANRPEETGKTPEVLLDYRKYFPDATRPQVAVDACISVEVDRLWRAGIRTGGCCCGHNGLFGPPSVFIVDPADAERAAEVLSTDRRSWHVLFWAGGSDA